MKPPGLLRYCETAKVLRQFLLGSSQNGLGFGQGTLFLSTSLLSVLVVLQEVVALLLQVLLVLQGFFELSALGLLCCRLLHLVALCLSLCFLLRSNTLHIRFTLSLGIGQEVLVELLRVLLLELGLSNCLVCLILKFLNHQNDAVASVGLGLAELRCFRLLVFLDEAARFDLWVVELVHAILGDLQHLLRGCLLLNERLVLLVLLLTSLGALSNRLVKLGDSVLDFLDLFFEAADGFPPFNDRVLEGFDLVPEGLCLPAVLEELILAVLLLLGV